MYCLRCQIEVSGDRCPQCGQKIDVPEKPEETASGAAQVSIPFEFASQTSGGKEAESPDWRLEVKRRLSQHIERKQDRQGGSRSGRKRQTAAQRKPRSSLEAPLFDYKLEDPPAREAKKKVVSLSERSQPAHPVAEKPVVRSPVSLGRSARHSLPQQKSLSLDSPARASIPPSPRAEEHASRERQISHEVIFSRILAGIVDVSLPVLISLVFTLTASKILNFDFISSLSMHLAGLFSLCFFLLNSLFFLFLSGQTPGMQLTDLRLVGEQSEDVPWQSLAVRIVLFLPTAVTVVGLVVAVFDPWCRCLHDRLSGTRVVPVSN